MDEASVTVDIARYSVQDELIMLARVLVALLAGAIVGFERGYSGKKAGIRTVSLVSMGAGLFTVVSIHGFDGQDQARVAAQVASGVGFLGAGTILREGASVRGLTTAAAIWVSASLGVAAGAGMFVLALGGAVLTALIMSLLPHDFGGRLGGESADSAASSPE